MSFKRRLLWLEDDPRTVKLTKNFFTDKGFDVTSFSSYEMALEEIKNNSYDCYLVDLDLGNQIGSGLDFIKSVRKKDKITPIFLFSAHIDEPVWRKQIKSIQLKIDGEFPKPLPIIGSTGFDNFFFSIESSVAKSMLLEIEKKYGKQASFYKFIEAQKERKKICFVLMPFKDPFNIIYNDHIKKIVELREMECIKADEIYNIRPIIEDIIELIQTSDLIIADLTTMNPNVFYELGVAHTLKKSCILITQKMEDVPFDIRHIRCIKYLYTPRGMQEFEDILNKTISFVNKNNIS
jgi:CheY-like chemotaxis protein